MIIEFQRKLYHIGKYEYQVIKNNNEYAKVFFEKGKHTHVLIQSDFADGNFSIEIPTLFGSSIKEHGVTKRVAGRFELLGQQGDIYYCTKKGSNFLNGIYFWTLEYGSMTYQIYEVGQGRKGIYYCIWCENNLVAVISKEMRTKNFESRYTIYSEEFVCDQLLVMLNAYWDITRYFSSESNDEWHTLNTWQKELKNKYNPSFIPMIKAMHGINQ